MKNILIVLLFSISINVNAQERINKDSPNISKNVLSELSKAQGFMLMNNGEWFETDKFITKDNLSLSLRKTLENEKDSRFCLDNFSNFQFREIFYNGKTYIILIKKAFNGQYKYNVIKKDWIGFNRYSYVILDKEELKNKLNNINDSSINKIELSVISVPEFILDFGEKDIIREIESKIIEEDKKLKDVLEKQEEHNKQIIKRFEERGLSLDKAPIQKPSIYKFIFHIYPFKDKNIVQFVLYGYKDDPNTKIKFPFFLETYPVLESNTAPYFGTDRMFEHCYYETDYNTFIKFANFGE